VNSFQTVLEIPDGWQVWL